MLSENEAVQTENEAGGRLRLRMSGRQLDLSLAQQSDAAKYSCVAVNVAGKAALHFNLQVLGRSLLTLFTTSSSSSSSLSSSSSTEFLATNY